MPVLFNYLTSVLLLPQIAGSDLVAVATRTQPPRLDGRLDDSVWSTAQPVTGFVQRDPVEGSAPIFRTEARVLYSGDALFVGIQADDPDPAGIIAPLARRDERPGGDWIGIMLDTYRDRRTALEFAVNAAGVRYDAYRFNDFEVDPSWDGVWEAKVLRDTRGWSTELRIPLSQLPFVPHAELRFGFHIYREVGRTHEVQHWALLSKQDRAVVSRFGDLVGLGELARGAPIELAPYVRGAVGSAASHQPLALGIDGRLALARGVSLTFAMNPDFGQVEADPAIVNLSSLETFFPERRPFFVQHSDLFRLPLNPDTMTSESLVYTRRIGRPPQLAESALASAGATAQPTRILGAMKLVGRTGTGWSFGLLGAATGRETARAEGGEPHERRTTEPRSLYGVARVRRDFREGRSQVAGFATVLAREQHPETVRLRSAAQTGGLMLSHRPNEGPYLARALVAFSHVSGTAAAIAATQQSAVHYFQRPDLRYAHFDSQRTSLSGMAGWLELGRDRGTLTGSIKVTSLSPGLEVNDLGFLSQAGKHSTRAVLSRRWLERPRFRSANMDVETFWDADWSGRTMSRGAGVRASTTLLNYTSLTLEAWRTLGGADPAALRGGPALERKGNGFYRFDVRSDANRTLRAGLTLVYRPFAEGLAAETRGSASIGWRPSPQFDTEGSLALERNHNQQQYVATGVVAGAPRYVVGWLHQKTVRLGLRVNYTVTPNVSLQAFVQPFATNGRYPAFFEVVKPAARRVSDRLAELRPEQIHRAGDQVALDIDGDATADVAALQPDFTALSFRSTTVLRWEFRQGSTLSLVLQQDGNDSETAAKDVYGELARVQSLSYRTIAMLKISYWLGF